MEWDKKEVSVLPWFASGFLFTKPSRHELNLQEKINLIKDKERGLSYLELKDRLSRRFGIDICLVHCHLTVQLLYTSSLKVLIQKKVDRFPKYKSRTIQASSGFRYVIVITSIQFSGI